MATATATITATSTSAVTLSNPVSLDELQLLGTPTINVDSTATVEGLLGLEEGYYVIVEPTDTATTNGTRLLAAYTTASAMTGLTATQRATVIVPPGKYDLGASELTMDTSYVDVVGLGANPRSVIITSTANPIAITATNANVSGVWVYGELDNTGMDATNVLDQCIFGTDAGSEYALQASKSFAGTFRNCRFNNLGRVSSQSTLAGSFINCEFDGSSSATAILAGGVNLRGCTSTAVFTASAATTVSIYQCAFAAADAAAAYQDGTNVTNDIGTPNNVFDAQVSI